MVGRGGAGRAGGHFYENETRLIIEPVSRKKLAAADKEGKNEIKGRSSTPGPARGGKQG